MRAQAQAPVAQFTSNRDSGCFPLIVQFFDNSTNSPTQWQWDLGNGNQSTLQNPSATYLVPGTYQIRLIARNANGVDTSVFKTIKVFGKPVIDFVSPDTLGCTPHTANFTSTATPGILANSITGYEWNFGDGGSSILPNPSYTYNINGNRSVSLKVTNDKGCFEIIGRPQYIKVGSGIDVNFDEIVTPACAPPITAFFTNTTTGNTVGTTYTWEFGNGATATNPDTVTYNYATPGIYNVRLIGVNSIGCRDTATKTIVANAFNTVINGPDSICAGTSAIFSYTSNTALLYNPPSLWRNGVNNTIYNNPSFNFLYASPGTFTIQLFANYGTCRDTIRKTLVVKPSPTVNWNILSDSVKCSTPLTVNFNNTSTGGNIYSWAFGPTGATSTDRDPVFTYTAAGNFTVRLTVTNSFACSTTVQRTNNVRIQAPTVSIAGTPAGGCAPFVFNAATGVTTTAVDSIVRYSWDFGVTTRTDDTSNVRNPMFDYGNNPGTYIVRLTIFTRTGCSVSATRTVVIGPRVTFGIAATPRTTCPDANIQFNITNLVGGTPPYTYTWNFGDGTTRTGTNAAAANPVKAYATTGTYNVRLSVTNATCTQVVDSALFIKVTPPTARLGNIRLSDCATPLTVNFQDSSILTNVGEPANPNSTIRWFFGNGDSVVRATNTPVAYTYAQPGNYTVRLVAQYDTLNGGCADTVTTTVRVANRGITMGATKSTLCRRDSLTFFAYHSNPAMVTSYQWNYGDGRANVTTNSATPRLTNTRYTNAGVYTARLVTFDIWGCTDTAFFIVTVNGPTALYTSNTTSGCIGPISFTDTSRVFGSNIISRVWNFGDGSGYQPATTQNPVNNTYLNPGLFTTRLIVTDANGCIDSLIKTNHLNLGLTKARFLSIDSLTCPGGTIRLTDSSTAFGQINNWRWTVTRASNNTIVPIPNTVSNPSFSLPNLQDTGLYHVKLRVASANGCADSVTLLNYITVKSPRAGFRMSDSITTCPPLPVNFTDTSYYVNHWAWDFQDGGISSQQNAINIFLVPGTYRVKLIGTSPGGCEDSAFGTIRIGGPFGSVGYSPLSGCAPLNNVRFQATATVPNVLFTWDFGDGVITTTNSVDTTSHNYQIGGDYIPKVLITDPAIGCTVPVPGPDTVHVEFARAQFLVDKTLLCDSGLVQFRDTTISNARGLTYSWDFGDGSPLGTGANPTHRYTATGVYNVRLAVTTQGGCTDDTTYTTLIKVVNSPRPIITMADTALCRPAPFTFNGSVVPDTATITRWQWYFGNGDSSQLQNPLTQTFPNSGTFNNTLTVTNASGCSTTVAQQVFVPSDDSLAVNFGGTPLVLCDSGRVTFRDSSLISVPGTASWKWFFSNNPADTANVQHPTFNYTSTGFYTVKLVVRTNKNCIDSAVFNNYVKVVHTSKPVITLTDSVLCRPANFTFTGSTRDIGGQPDTSQIVQWFWNFGNGATSLNQNPAGQIFTVSGTFPNTLTIVNSSGCVDSVKRNVKVPLDDSLQAFFRADRRIICDSGTINFTDTSILNLPGTFSYQWDFGDGTPVVTTNARVVSHFYAAAGKYNVKLIVNSSIGCTDTIEKADYILVVKPRPNISVADTVQCRPGNFTFRGDTIGYNIPAIDTFPIVSWNWQFGGNGATSTLRNPPTQLFPNSGRFLTTLTVTNNIGCVTIDSQYVRVLDDDSLVVGFRANPLRLCDTGTVNFIDTSLINIPGAISWEWNFGDNSPVNNSQNPSHFYAGVGSYNVKLKVTSSLPGCRDSVTYSDYIRVLGKPQPVITFTTNDSICFPATFGFTGGQLPSDTSTITNWQWSFGNGNTANVQNPSSQLFTAVGSTTTRLTITNLVGCVKDTTVTTTVMPLPALTINRDTTICRGDAIMLNAGGANTYIWAPGTSLSSTTIANPIAAPTTDITYGVRGFTSFGCFSDTLVRIRVMQPYTLGVVQTLDSICAGTNTQLTAFGAPLYNWTPAVGLSATNIPNPIASPSLTTTYTVTGFDTLNCFAQSQNVTVRVFQYPTVNAGADVILSAGATHQFNPTVSGDVVSYSWSPATNLSNPTIANPIATAFDNIAYILTVTNDGNCTSSDTVRILVNCDNSNVFIPNTFSPNNDGINDVFFVRGKGLYAVSSLRIFNRWGQMVFEKRNVTPNNPADGWDGTINGKRPQSDAYVYVVEVQCTTGQTLKYTGTITLVN